VRCPICKSPLPPPAPGQRSFSPFCSERCKLIDLGRWLDGKYQIPVRETDRDLNDDVPKQMDEHEDRD
jgi:uncharacterized protein